MKKILLIVSLFLAACSQKNEQNTNFETKVEALASFQDTSTALADFGDPVTTSTTRIFTFKNVGTTAGPATPTLIGTPNSSFTIVLQTGCANVNVGSTCTLRVNFNPLGKAAGGYADEIALGGIRLKTLTARIAPPTGGGGSATIEATVSSAVIPNPLDYGSFSGTQSSTKIIRLKNTGTTSTGPHTAALSDTDFTFTLNGCSNKTLAPNAYCDVRVTFNASSKTAQEYLTDLTFAGSTFPLKATVAASGGTTTSGGGTPSIAILEGTNIASDPLNYGSFSGTQSLTKILTVKNTGSSSVVVNPVLSEPSFKFILNSCANKTLTPNGTCSVRVSFSAVGQTSGAKTSTLTVHSSKNLTLTAVVSGAVIENPILPSIPLTKIMDNLSYMDGGYFIPIALVNRDLYIGLSTLSPMGIFKINIDSVNQSQNLFQTTNGVPIWSERNGFVWYRDRKANFGANGEILFQNNNQTELGLINPNSGLVQTITTQNGFYESAYSIGNFLYYLDSNRNLKQLNLNNNLEQNVGSLDVISENLIRIKDEIFLVEETTSNLYKISNNILTLIDTGVSGYLAEAEEKLFYFKGVPGNYELIKYDNGTSTQITGASFSSNDPYYLKKINNKIVGSGVPINGYGVEPFFITNNNITVLDINTSPLISNQNFCVRVSGTGNTNSPIFYNNLAGQCFNSSKKVYTCLNPQGVEWTITDQSALRSAAGQGFSGSNLVGFTSACNLRGGTPNLLADPSQLISSGTASSLSTNLFKTPQGTFLYGNDQLLRLDVVNQTYSVIDYSSYLENLNNVYYINQKLVILGLKPQASPALRLMTINEDDTFNLIKEVTQNSQGTILGEIQSTANDKELLIYELNESQNSRSLYIFRP